MRSEGNKKKFYKTSY